MEIEAVTANTITAANEDRYWITKSKIANKKELDKQNFQKQKFCNSSQTIRVIK